MLRPQLERANTTWCRGEYGNDVILRFTFLLLVWVFYALIPHKLPTNTLLLFSLLLLGYAAWSFRERKVLRAWLLMLATLLNTLLVPMLNAGKETILLCILISLIFLFDIATTR